MNAEVFLHLSKSYFRIELLSHLHIKLFITAAIP